MYRVDFRNFGQGRRCWTAYLPEYTGSTMIRHLQKRGVELAWESEEPFGQPWPSDDESGAVEGVISSHGQEIGRFKATPLTEEESARIAAEPEFDVSDSILCEENADGVVYSGIFPGGSASGPAEIAASLASTDSDIPY